MMKFTRNASVILLAGLCAIGLALWYRQVTLKRRSAVGHTFQQSVSADVPAKQPPTTLLHGQAAQLEARVAAHPEDVSAHQALIRIYQSLGLVAPAMEQMEAIVRLQPQSRDAHLALANGRLALKQWPQAEQTFREMTRRWPKDNDGWQGLAAAQYHQGHFQEAAVAAQKALALQPANPSNRFVLACSLQEYAMQYPQPQLHTGALEWARREFDRLTKVWPTTGDVYLRLGRICIATRDFAPAIKYLLRAAQLLPKRADAPLFLAKAYTASGNVPAARAVLEQAVASHPNAADLCDALGQLVQSSGETNADQRSFALFQHAVQLAPRNARFQERLGAAALRANDLETAQRAFQTAAQLDPNRAFPCQQLAAVYTRMKDPKRAAEAAKRSEALSDNAQRLSHLEAMVNTYPQSVTFRTDLADRYRFLGNIGAARNEYLMLLRLEPSSRHAAEALLNWITRAPQP